MVTGVELAGAVMSREVVGGKVCAEATASGDVEGDGAVSGAVFAESTTGFEAGARTLAGARALAEGRVLAEATVGSEAEERVLVREVSDAARGLALGGGLRAEPMGVVLLVMCLVLEDEVLPLRVSLEDSAGCLGALLMELRLLVWWGAVGWWLRLLLLLLLSLLLLLLSLLLFLSSWLLSSGESSESDESEWISVGGGLLSLGSCVAKSRRGGAMSCQVRFGCERNGGGVLSDTSVRSKV